MSQNNYILRIVAALLFSENHIRGLAKALSTNQTTISRKIAVLFEENVVDFREQGKNKVYFLKKTLEAKQYTYLVEVSRLIEAIKKYSRLRFVVEKIRQNRKVQVAAIFGSYAKGTAGEDSDIDLYANTENREIKKELEAIDSKLSVKIGKYNHENILIKEIDKYHIIIKGVEQYYEQRKFFD